MVLAGGAVAAVLLLLGGGWWWLRRRLLVVMVEGPSMEPTYHDGDRLLARRLRRREAPRPGEVVVVQLPPTALDRTRLSPGDATAETAAPVSAELAGRLIKRVTASTVAPQGRMLHLVGDNPAASIDSRHFGAVPVEHCLGTVLRPMWR